MRSDIFLDGCNPQDDMANITEERASELLYTPVDTIIITIIIPTVLCLGVTTNSTYLFVVLRVPKMRVTMNLYLAHLAVADLLYLTLCSSFYLWSYAASPKLEAGVPFANSAGCISFDIAQNTGYFASIALITMVSYERYLALCQPMRHHTVHSQQRTYRIIAICWLIALLYVGVTVPVVARHMELCLGWPDDPLYWELPSTVNICIAIHPWIVHYTEPLISLSWLILLAGNVYMYVCIIQQLYKSRGLDSNRITQTDQKTLHVRNQFTKMLIVNGAVFFICQAPMRICNFMRWVDHVADNPNFSFVLGDKGWIPIILQLINTVVNPLIYNAMLPQYRAAFLQTFCCKFPLATDAAENVNTAQDTKTKLRETKV